MLDQFADNLTINDLYTAPEGFKSWHETGKAWAMMHQMKFEDPDGFRRTPVSAPLPRRGTDAGRRRGQSAVSSLYSAVRPGAQPMAQSRAQASLVASAPEPRPRPQLRRCNFAGVSCLRASRQVVVAVEYEQIAAAPLALQRVPRRQLVALSAGMAHRRRVCRPARPARARPREQGQGRPAAGPPPARHAARAQPMKLPMSSRT